MLRLLQSQADAGPCCTASVERACRFMLHLDLPVRTELRYRPLRFKSTPVVSKLKRGLFSISITVETVGEPHFAEDLVLAQGSEMLREQIHQLFRDRTVFLVRK
jgi:hypothetical protein